MSRFKLTKEAMKLFLDGKLESVKNEFFDSFFPMPSIEGTILFDSITFSIEKEFETAKVELYFKGDAVAEMDIDKVYVGGKVTLVLQEGIMRIVLNY